MPKKTKLLQSLAEMSVPGHFCLLCGTKTEQSAVAAAFARIGRERGEDVLLCGPPEMMGSARAEGDVRSTEAAQGVAGGVDLLERALEAAAAEGRRPRRVLVDAAALLGVDPGAHAVADYEERIERLVLTRPVLICCLFRRDIFPSRLIKQAIYSHPLFLHRGEICRNPRPIPPGLYRQADPESREIESLIDALGEQTAVDRERELTVKLLRLVHSRTEMREFLQVLIEFLRTWSGCESVGIRLREGEDFPYVETRSTAGGRREQDRLCTFVPSSDPAPSCICGNILAGRIDASNPFVTPFGSFWTNALSALRPREGIRPGERHNRCRVEEFESVALIPLRFGEETFGLLQLSDGRRGRLTPQLVSLLERAAGSVTLAMVQRRSEERLRRSQEALHASESRYRTLMEMAATAIFVADAETGGLLEANRKALDLLGCTPEDIRRMHQWELHPPEDRERARLRFARDVAEGSGFTDDLFLLGREGRRIPVEISGSTVRVGERRLVLGIFRDVTGRRQMEENLRQALAEAEGEREKIEGILRSVGDGLLVMERNGRIVRMNEAAEQLLGFHAADVLEQPADLCLAKVGIRNGVRDLFCDLPERPYAEFELQREVGQAPRVIQARVSLLQERAGKGTRVVVLRDVTRERDLDRMKSEFISTAAHELRTPLTAVLGYAELLLDSGSEERFSPEVRREFLTEIHDKGEALARIVGELLDISRIEAGQPIPLERRPCRIDELVRRVVASYQTFSPHHRFELVLDENPPERFLLDRDKVVQVLENLLSNAVKYSQPGTRIRIAGEMERDCYRLVVADEGKGMTPEQLERVFDKFYRADASHTAVGGLGLGMSIARHIVKAHGGDIRVESALGQGTTVIFTVPALDGSCPLAGWGTL